MKFILCLIPVATFIVRSDGLYIPRAQSEYMSRELAQPNLFADVAYKKSSWPSHIVKPRVQKDAVLTKRTTDDASPNRQKEVDRDVASVAQDPKIKQAAKSHRKSIDDLLEDSKLHEMAQSSGYPVEELAKAKRRWLDAISAVDVFKRELAGVGKVRKVTREEKGQLKALVKVASQQVTVWRRMSLGKPVDQRVRRKKSIEDLMENAELDDIAQSSGYPVEELAKAKRRWLDARNAVSAFKKKLAEVEKVRNVSPEETAQLQALAKVASQQVAVWRRMRLGNPVDQRVPRPKKSIDDLLEDPKLLERAQSSGYPVEALAKAKRRWLDAINDVDAFKKELAEVEKVRKVTPEEKRQLQASVKAASQQETVFRRMSAGFPVDQRVPRDKKSIDDFLEDPKLHEMAQSSGYPVEELAKAKRRWLDARNAVGAFEKELAGVEKVRKVTPEEKRQLQTLVKAASQQRTEFRRMSQGLPVDSIDVAALRPDTKVDEVAHPNPVAQEIEGYNQLFLDASNTLRAFEKQMAVAQQAGHSPTPDVKAQHRALQDDFNMKKTMWFRARDGTPVDRVVHKRREPKTAPSPETRRPGSQEQASQASPAKEDPSTTHSPLQMSGRRRLLAPFFFSASHLLQGLGRQWRAIPWTRYLADPRLNRVNPAELLRAEHALP
ncbi:MAG: hypothetical protein M1826_000933 [Phylliscum demangeonii]|nr:MAG: hypothetical protein M1826_000933 [Phylliscum demangeonii]